MRRAWGGAPSADAPKLLPSEISFNVKGQWPYPHFKTRKIDGGVEGNFLRAHKYIVLQLNI